MNNLLNILQQASQHFQNGNLGQAEQMLKYVLLHQPKNFDAMHILGIVNALKGNSQEAIRLFRKALKIHSTNNFLHFNLGKVLHETGQLREALIHHAQAAKIAPTHAEAWVHMGLTHHELHQWNEAVACYEEAISINPGIAEAWSNLGNTFSKLNQYDRAQSCYERALSINPSLAETWSNLGNALSNANRFQDALNCQERALEINPNFAMAWSNKGNILKKSGRHVDAAISYQRANTIDPDIPYLPGSLLHAQIIVCDWRNFSEYSDTILKGVVRGKKVVDPFMLLALPSSPEQQKKCSEIYVNDKLPRSTSHAHSARKPPNRKIRIGYFSADFHNHATSYLMAGMFERHDRSDFELIGFSFGPPLQDEMRSRVTQAFDRFEDVRQLSDQEIVQLARSLSIDIAVDLKGFTKDARTGIFAMRPAPIQVNYLGYPGTMGADFIDYLVADATLIPPDEQKHYSEKIVYLPNTYQVNDSERRISERALTRADVGLPPEGFVFCCFNNNYKITPDLFDAWMRLLQKVPGSVLWLLEDNPDAAQNLKREAEQRNIQSDRLIFAQRMSLPEHLARQQLADLFLDTWYYNAHTTTSDALWAGLPVLTTPGESFPSRVAASLLKAVDLTEMIANSKSEYETLAVELATYPDKLAAAKDKLADNRLSKPLFDTALFTKHLEDAYKQMIERHHKGLRPEHIYVLG